MQKCKEIIKKYVNNNSTIVVSCSGGPDSMCLLKNTIDLKEELNLNIIVAHINHNVRRESDSEEEMVKKYALDNGLIFESYKITDYSKENFHNEARIKRYNFMKEIIKKYQADFLFTAHHGDDLMETIFMRIARGSNLKGYSGFKMLSKQDGYQVLRPLIYYTKDEIIKYDDENNILYALDQTNYSDDYTRNRYRNHILPFLKAEDSNIHLKYLDYSNKISEADDYISNIVSDKMKDIYNNNVLDVTIFNEIDDLIKRRIIENILYDVYHEDLYLIGDKNILEIIKLINKKGNGKIKLPNNFWAIKEYNKLSIKKDNIVNDYEEILNKEVIIPNMGRLIITNELGDSNYYLKINSKEISLPLIVRNRKDGDKIAVKNLLGTQKVKKVFIDYKILNEKRKIWPIVCDSTGEVLWIPGLKKSKFDKENSEMYDIIVKYEEEENE